MDESKMPELPEQTRNGWYDALYTADQMTAYARQCIAPLQAQIAALESDAQRSLEERLQMAVDQSRMEQEVAGLRADAGRYRWLKTCDDWIQFQGFAECEPEGLDAAVDTALNGGALRPVPAYPG